MIKVCGKSISTWAKIKLFVGLNAPSLPKRQKRLYRVVNFDGYDVYVPLKKR